MRYALIKNDIVVSLTECDNETEAQRRAEVHSCEAVECPEGYGIGSTFKDNEWGNPLEVEEATPEPSELEQLRADVDYLLLLSEV